jgi:hypothetical protein
MNVSMNMNVLKEDIGKQQAPHLRGLLFTLFVILREE